MFVQSEGAGVLGTLPLDLSPRAINYGYPKDTCTACPRQDSLELHHIVPLAYGGRESPLVWLCHGCHSFVHAMGENAQPVSVLVDARKARPFKELGFETLVMLGGFIRKAKQKASKSPNKSKLLTLRLPGSTAAKLKWLQAATGESRLTLVCRAIDLLYSSTRGVKDDNQKG